MSFKCGRAECAKLVKIRHVSVASKRKKQKPFDFQCAKCKTVYHSKKCAALRLSIDRTRVCESCYPRCDHCGRDSRRGTACEHCGNYYCGPCTIRYFDITGEKEKSYDLRVAHPKRMARCAWCDLCPTEQRPLPTLMNESNVPEGACEWCWVFKKRHVAGVLGARCKCGLGDLCQPHFDNHNCAARCLLPAQTTFIDQHANDVKNHIFEKLRGETHSLSALCYDMAGFPRDESFFASNGKRRDRR